MQEPAKFRKRSPVVEAMPYDGTEACATAILDWIGAGNASYRPQIRAIFIPTREGVKVVLEEDWVLKGESGEFQPCQREIFETTYEPVTESSS